MRMIESVEWIEKDGALRLLDQRALPGREAYVVCRAVEDVALAIENMTVRGAPAIGIAAAYLYMREIEIKVRLQDKAGLLAALAARGVTLIA